MCTVCMLQMLCSAWYSAFQHSDRRHNLQLTLLKCMPTLMYANISMYISIYCIYIYFDVVSTGCDCAMDRAATSLDHVVVQCSLDGAWEWGWNVWKDAGSWCMDMFWHFKWTCSAILNVYVYIYIIFIYIYVHPCTCTNRCRSCWHK